MPTLSEFPVGARISEFVAKLGELIGVAELHLLRTYSATFVASRKIPTKS